MKCTNSIGQQVQTVDKSENREAGIDLIHNPVKYIKAHRKISELL